MPNGVLLQLAAIGKENINLTSNPEVTLFKSIYKRHTPFSMTDMVSKFDSDIKFGQVCKAKINKSGDLLTNLYLHFNINISEEDDTEYSFINKLGYNMIEYVELRIGQNIIDKITGEWLLIYQELFDNKNKFLQKLN